MGAALVVLPLVTMLVACGSSSSGGNATAPATQAPSSTSSSGVAGAVPNIPGASGLIAAASPGTLQVQSATAQTTVIYSASTRFSAVTAGHVAAGDCVMATGTLASGSTKALTATSVRIVAKVNGACTASGGFGGVTPGGVGSFPRRTGGTYSGGASAGSGARRAFASATGTVSSVAGSTILVAGVLRGSLGTARSTTPASPTTITVTLGSSVTVTQTVSATSTAAVVGQCARAIGPANNVGAITAKSITISTPGPNGCNAGFGGGPNGNGAIGTGNAASPNA